jgi:hypothetical protein
MRINLKLSFLDVIDRDPHTFVPEAIAILIGGEDIALHTWDKCDGTVRPVPGNVESARK